MYFWFLSHSKLSLAKTDLAIKILPSAEPEGMESHHVYW